MASPEPNSTQSSKLQRALESVDDREPLLVFWDLETTGLALDSGITQIAAVVCLYDRSQNKALVVSRFNQYCRPEAPLTPASIRVTGIDAAELDRRGAVPERKAVDQFLTWVGDLRVEYDRVAVGIAHNGDRFDLPVLFHAMYRMTGKGKTALFPFEACIDTLPAARQSVALRPTRNKKLQTLFDFVSTDKDRASLPAGEAHRADVDAEMLRVVYMRCFAKLTSRIARSTLSVVKQFNSVSRIRIDVEEVDHDQVCQDALH